MGDLEDNLQFLDEYFGVQTDASLRRKTKMGMYKILWRTKNKYLIKKYLIRNKNDFEFQLEVRAYHQRKRRESMSSQN